MTDGEVSGATTRLEPSGVVELLLGSSPGIQEDALYCRGGNFQGCQRSWVSPECGMERGDGIQSNCTLIKGRERLLQILCVCARACVWRGRERERERDQKPNSLTVGPHTEQAA